MKNILKSVIINSTAFYIASVVVKGFQFTGGVATLIIAGLAFTLINALVKPLVSLFLLPFNLITLGLFSWIINVIMLHLLTVAVPEIKITAWQFMGINYHGFVVPSINFSSLQTLIIASFLISFTTSVLNWLAKE